MALKFWASMPFFQRDSSRSFRDVLLDQLTIAHAAEDLGWEGVVVPENHFQNYLVNPSAMAVSAVIAAQTKRLKIHPGVVVLPYYHPLLVASEMGLLEGLAPGRVSLGVARGGSRLQFDRIGVPYEEARGRYEEALEIIQRVWTENDVEFDGKYYSFPKTTVVSKGDTPLEIWVASQSLEGIRKVAEDGHNLLTSPNWGHFEPHGDLDTLLGSYNNAVAESGKPRGEVMVMRHVWVGATEEEALKYFDEIVNHSEHYMAIVQAGGENRNRTKEERLTRRVDGEMSDIVKDGWIRTSPIPREKEGLFERMNDPIMTTPDRMIERFKHYEKIGVDHVSLHQDWGQPVEAIVENMKMLTEEVFPAFEENAEKSSVKSPAGGAS